MDQQRHQLMQAHPFAPSGGEWVRLVVRRDDRVQMGRTEQRQHRQICFAMTPVRAGVDEPASAIGAPEDVS